MKHCWMHETTADMLYTFLCRGESTDVPFLQRISHITSNYIKAGRSIDEIPVGDFFAPSLLDFTHGSYLCIDLDVFLTRQSKNRGPNSSTFLPRRGLEPFSLIWSAISMKSPRW